MVAQAACRQELACGKARPRGTSVADTVMASHNCKPKARHRHTSEQVANKVLVYSGRTDAESAIPPSVVEVFDPVCETWEEKESRGDLPAQGLHDAASASSDSDFFTYGGKDDDGNFVDSLHQLSAETYEWCTRSSRGKSPMPKWLAAMAACKDRLALLGGFGVPRDPIQDGSSFKKTTCADGRGWTNEFHIYHLNEGMHTCMYGNDWSLWHILSHFLFGCMYILAHCTHSLQKQNCSFNKDPCHVGCTCVTLSILHSQVLHNHNISLSCGHSTAQNNCDDIVCSI